LPNEPLPITLSKSKSLTVIFELKFAPLVIPPKVLLVLPAAAEEDAAAVGFGRLGAAAAARGWLSGIGPRGGTGPTFLRGAGALACCPMMKIKEEINVKKNERGVRRGKRGNKHYKIIRHDTMTGDDGGCTQQTTHESHDTRRL
jgi:hypothetical protein